MRRWLAADIRSLKAFEQDPEVAELSHASEAVGLGIVRGQRPGPRGRRRMLIL